MLTLTKIIPILTLLYHGIQGANGCQEKSFGTDSFVCVCGSDYCDDFPEVTVEEGQFKHIFSSKLVHRFNVSEGLISDAPLPENTVITINLTETHQTMLGFGGAFTDATGINIATLSMAVQEKLLRSYFSTSGLEYNIGRIPIASCDFSTHPYSYDDVDGDILLEHFALTPEDHIYKLPYIKWALSMSERPLLFFGSPWSPPAWMKENGMFNGTGGIKREMWQPYSNYIVKFVESYEAEGVPLWGLTPQNEPVMNGGDWHINGCEWNTTNMRDWIKTTLGPTLEAAGMRRLKLMILDHNRDSVPWYPEAILEDSDASQYVDGVAIHWYEDKNIPTEKVDLLHEHYPEKFILYTEACTVVVNLGSWDDAESYGHDIIEDINHWSTGWLDWNMALDMQGGPNWATNYVNSPIMIDKDEDVFYKQPMFYAMGHFSKFITAGDVRVSFNIAPATTADEEVGYDNLELTAILKENGRVVVVIMNTLDEEHSISIVDTKGSVVNVDLEPRSINTILYDPLAK
ncbi:putative glucosylceramidase 3 isoform X3 [Macrobrachium rosenbergii]|uniref:putative glucosylceramidase 3 isoform X2 n=1 Tax=Macrobrachium rosenbergii TaxID=79674 RepID=UPI0034D69C5E